MDEHMNNAAKLGYIVFPNKTLHTTFPINSQSLKYVVINHVIFCFKCYVVCVCACVFVCACDFYYKNSAIVLHANLRLLPILLQIRDGLKLYGFCDIMAKYPDICQPLFVPGVEMKVSAP